MKSLIGHASYAVQGSAAYQQYQPTPDSSAGRIESVSCTPYLLERIQQNFFSVGCIPKNTKS
ncbi:MAG TPA: hypothetical protein VGE93_18095 [Bryobacteraceae bacterium]